MVLATWTKAEINALRAAHSEGHNSSACAALLGMTRNAIISKAKHIGIRFIRRGPRKARGGQKRVGAVRMHRPKFNAPAVMPVPVKARPEVIKAPLPLNLPMAQLEPGMCKYPTGQAGRLHLFCGTESIGAWCTYHRGIVYEPIKKRVR